MCSYLIEAHELGESGTPHIQGYAQLKVPLRIAQVSKLCPKAHFEVARGTPYQNFLYCAKGEQSHAEWMELKDAGPKYGKNAEFLEYGTRPKAPINAHKKKPCTTYNEALAAPTVREGMEIVQKQRARDYCLHGESIERNLRRTKVPVFKCKYALTDFNVPPLDLSKPCFLSGLSNSGKTQYALAHFKNPLFVRHIDKLKQLGPDHDGIVFDDMSFTHWPPESVIALLDMEEESQIHVRYGTITIPAYIKKIFSSNKKNIFYNFDCDTDQIPAIERRYTRFNITQPLYGNAVAQGTTNAYSVMVGAHNPVPLIAPGQFADRYEYDEGSMDEVD